MFILKNSLGTVGGASGFLFLARGRNAPEVNDVAYALTPGPRVVGTCALPDGSCAERDLAECGSAGGTFDGVGSFCPIPCLARAPTLSWGVVVGLMCLLRSPTGDRASKVFREYRRCAAERGRLLPRPTASWVCARSAPRPGSTFTFTLPLHR